MSSINTEYTLDCNCEEAVEAFNRVSNGEEVNWVSPAPIHPRTTAPLLPGRPASEVMTEMAIRCEDWPENETTLYWDIHIPEIDTLIDPKSSESVRRPHVSTLNPPPTEIKKLCQEWYETENEGIESTLSNRQTVVLRGFFIKTVLKQDASIDDIELVAIYTTLDRDRTHRGRSDFSK